MKKSLPWWEKTCRYPPLPFPVLCCDSLCESFFLPGLDPEHVTIRAEIIHYWAVLFLVKYHRVELAAKGTVFVY